MLLKLKILTLASSSSAGLPSRADAAVSLLLAAGAAFPRIEAMNSDAEIAESLALLSVSASLSSKGHGSYSLLSSRKSDLEAESSLEASTLSSAQSLRSVSLSWEYAWKASELVRLANERSNGPALQCSQARMISLGLLILWYVLVNQPIDWLQRTPIFISSLSLRGFCQHPGMMWSCLQHPPTESGGAQA
jgi:hypothetical protein